MVQLSHLDWAIWLTSIFFECALTGYMLRTGTCRRWRGLFVLVSVLSLRDGARLFAILVFRDPYTDFWAYWAGELLTAIAKIWMISDVARALFGPSDWSRKVLGQYVWGIAILFMAFSLVMGFREHRDLLNDWFYWANYIPERANKAVSLAALSIFILVGMIGDALAEWSHGVRGIAAGLSIELLSSCVIGWLTPIPALTHHRNLLANIGSVSFVVSLVIWFFSVRPPQIKTTVDYRHAIARLGQQIDAYAKHLEAARRAPR